MSRMNRIDRTALAPILFILSIPVEFSSTRSLHSNDEAYKLPVTAVTMGDLSTVEIRNCGLLLRRNRARVLRGLNGVRFDNSFGSSDAEALNCRPANQQHRAAEECRLRRHHLKERSGIDGRTT